MDWIERLNQAVGYIDKNLTSEINYEEISRITVAPISLFQRFFVLAAGITLSEYIRRRKLTGALIDLQTTGEKIADIAYKYKYESSDTFCVAFKRLYGVTPSQAKTAGNSLKHYDRIYFNLTITYVKGENEMVLLNIDKYRYYDPLFEGARIILNNRGEKFTPEYIQGISGSAFKIAGGCPSCPTSIYDKWPHKFIRYLGYETKHYPCFDKNGKDVTDIMIEAVKKSIDDGKPALVWNAFSVAEYDVVCGYDNEAKHFVGRCALKGNDDYVREPWHRAKTCDCAPVLGAIVIGEKISDFDAKEAEIQSVINAVKHARKESDNEGIAFYRKWADEYFKKGKERGVSDAYCYDVYSSVRKAAAVYLHELGYSYDGAVSDCFHYAAASFERESNELENARPYLSWESPWGIDEKRSKNLAPILFEAAQHYEKAIEYLEKILKLLNREVI
jgi:AraC-like DNA-binding protein